MWLRIAASWRIANLPGMLVTHQVRAASVTRMQQRAIALRGRLRAQWETASILGPWPLALPALGVGAVTHLPALAGGGSESVVRGLAGRLARRARGFRAPGVQDDPR
jgi:hypothetical protein